MISGTPTKPVSRAAAGGGWVSCPNPADIGIDAAEYRQAKLTRAEAHKPKATELRTAAVLVPWPMQHCLLSTHNLGTMAGL